jgi:uncharacterized protein (DUF1697 family)
VLYEKLDFEDVKTYIQSGNVIFRSKINSLATLQKKIAGAIEKQYGFTVPVTIRTCDEFKRLISSNPFLIRKNVDSSKLHVTFLETNPAPVQIKSLESVDSKDDELCVSGSEIYLYCPGGYGKTRLSNNFIESKLKQPATTRNWNTVNKLYEMSSSN